MNVAKLGIGLLAVLFTPAVTGDSPTVYRCVHDGAIIYSDRPCGADAAVHENDSSRVTIYEPPPITQRAAPTRAGKARSPKSKSARKAGGSPEQRPVQCAKLDQSMRDVRAKMRSGYGVKEGERLKARRRQLTERRREQKCR